jgi:Salmonella virulence plasmid 65kDa B protein
MLIFVAGKSLANGTHTGHQFSVTETGAATISIPIQVPRGIGGMEPQLSMNYSSGAGNGLLGVGWTLAGPSAITRCPKSIQHDGVRGAVTFAVGDKFCLDGQRLLSSGTTNDTSYGTGGTTYSTERESFSRITATGNYATGVPAGFKVETKAGLILEFGTAVDAQVLTNPVSGSPTTINRWLLKRMYDRMGGPVEVNYRNASNYVEFNYCSREVAADLTCPTTGTYSGSQVLHYIRYTNRGATPNGTAAVMFGYEARADRQLQFHAGTSQVQTQRMAYIATYLGFSSPSSPGQRIKVYEFTYDSMKDATQQQWTRATNVSRLIRVQEVSGAVGALTRPPPTRAASEALPPLEFKYAPDTLYGKAISQDATTGTSAPPPLPECGGYVGKYRYRELCP